MRWQKALLWALFLQKCWKRTPRGSFVDENWCRDWWKIIMWKRRLLVAIFLYWQNTITAQSSSISGPIGRFALIWISVNPCLYWVCLGEYFSHTVAGWKIWLCGNPKPSILDSWVKNTPINVERQKIRYGGCFGATRKKRSRIAGDFCHKLHLLSHMFSLLSFPFYHPYWPVCRNINIPCLWLNIQ